MLVGRRPVRVTAPDDHPAGPRHLWTLERVLRGGSWNVLGQAAIILASLVATPFVLRLLGPELYGLFALVQVAVAYLAFADLGMSPASSRFGAAAHARSDDASEVAVVWTSLVLAAVPSVVVAAALVVWGRLLVVDGLGLRGDLANQGVLALRIASVGFVARAVAEVANTPEVTRMRWDLYVGITSGGILLQTIVVPFVLWAGGGLAGAIGVISAVSVATALAHLLVGKRLQPLLWPPRIERRLVRPLASFGGAMVGAHMTSLVLINVDRLLVGRLVSISDVAYYSVAATAAGLLNVIPFAVSHPLLTTFAGLEATGVPSETAELYRRLTRLALVVLLPVVALLCVAARPALRVWAGNVYAVHSTAPFYFLAVGFLFSALGAVPWQLLSASGRADLVFRYHLAELAPYLALAVVLIRAYGIRGAAVAWTIRSIVNTALYFRAARRLLPAALGPDRERLRTWFVAAGSLAVPAGMAIAMSGSGSGSGALVVAVLAASLGAYGWLVWAGILSAQDKGNICDLLSAARARCTP
jgi:O-antigen/teichoic acid export membrane protein